MLIVILSIFKELNVSVTYQIKSGLLFLEKQHPIHISTPFHKLMIFKIKTSGLLIFQNIEREYLGDPTNKFSRYICLNDT